MIAALHVWCFTITEKEISVFNELDTSVAFVGKTSEVPVSIDVLIQQLKMGEKERMLNTFANRICDDSKLKEIHGLPYCGLCWTFNYIDNNIAPWEYDKQFPCKTPDVKTLDLCEFSVGDSVYVAPRWTITLHRVSTQENTQQIVQQYKHLQIEDVARRNNMSPDRVRELTDRVRESINN